MHDDTIGLDGRRARVLLVCLVALLVGLGSASPAAAVGVFFDDDGSGHEPSIEALAAAGFDTRRLARIGVVR